MDDKTKEVIKALETVKEYCQETKCENCAISLECFYTMSIAPHRWSIEEGDKNEKQVKRNLQK